MFVFFLRYTQLHFISWRYYFGKKTVLRMSRITAQVKISNSCTYLRGFKSHPAVIDPCGQGWLKFVLLPDKYCALRLALLNYS